MKDYLINTFNYNNGANKRLLSTIKQLPDPSLPVKLFSHLINCQYKWMARVVQDPKAAEMSWWDPLYLMADLETEWNKSLQLWIGYLQSITEDELNTEVQFIGFDDGMYAATPLDIALQLNYHSIHHRAQIQTMIRQQGLEPEFLDYIGTKYRKLS